MTSSRSLALYPPLCGSFIPPIQSFPCGYNPFYNSTCFKPKLIYSSSTYNCHFRSRYACCVKFYCFFSKLFILEGMLFIVVDACKMTVPAARLCHARSQPFIWIARGFLQIIRMSTYSWGVAKHDPYLKKEHYFSQTFASCIHFGVSIILLFWGYSGCVFLLAIIGIWSNVVSSDSLHFPRRSGIVEPVCLSCRRKLQGYIIPWELIWGKWGELPPLPPQKLKTCSL